MEYGIRQLSELSGVSARTLRYYDQVNLLKPGRITEAGYRYYGLKEVELLQQILFYKERGFGLSEISEIIYNEEFDELSAMEEHLSKLQARQRDIAEMIDNVKETIASMKGEHVMSDEKRFEVFKKRMVEKNEEAYGKEIRKAYGDKQVDESNAKMLHMTQKEYQTFSKLEKEILESLEEAVRKGQHPEDETGRKIALMHKRWISMTWNQYSVQAHKGVAAMYTADERFKDYYDRNLGGCAKFLQEAIEYHM